MSWTTEWPTEDGWYWMFTPAHQGQVYPVAESLRPIEVCGDTVVSGNSFVYRTERAQDYFQPMQPPNLPEETRGEE